MLFWFPVASLAQFFQLRKLAGSRRTSSSFATTRPSLSFWPPSSSTQWFSIHSRWELKYQISMLRSSTVQMASCSMLNAPSANTHLTHLSLWTIFVSLRSSISLTRSFSSTCFRTLKSQWQRVKLWPTLLWDLPSICTVRSFWRKPISDVWRETSANTDPFPRLSWFVTHRGRPMPVSLVGAVMECSSKNHSILTI